MAKAEIEVRLVRKWPTAEIVALYEAGGWWNDTCDSRGIGPLMRGSFAFAVAVDSGTGRAVGMGRVISDGHSDAYIQDVVVLPRYRRRGIGRMLIAALLARCRKKGLGWIGLIAEEGSERLYEGLGFAPFKGRPMRHGGKWPKEADGAESR